MRGGSGMLPQIIASPRQERHQLRADDIQVTPLRQPLVTCQQAGGAGREHGGAHDHWPWVMALIIPRYLPHCLVEVAQ